MKRPILFKECQQYSISLWECPSFLFLVLGAFNVLAMISTYFIASAFEEEPELVALITIFVSLVIFIIGSLIVHSFDKLASLNKMKTEFIRIASHQLRTPLSAIRWSMDLLMSSSLGKPTAEQIEYLSIIRESNSRMLHLINSLLDVTKIEMGNLKLDLSTIDLKTIIQKEVEMIMPLARAHNVIMNIMIEEELPFVFSDEEKIKMVVSNLIDNAIKYSKGRGEVLIEAKANDRFVEVKIKDNGVGIPKDQQKNVFQKFFRSDNIMRHQTIGSGLGLFIARAIVEANRGKIWFESEEGSGTAFCFKIPIAK